MIIVKRKKNKFFLSLQKVLEISTNTQWNIFFHPLSPVLPPPTGTPVSPDRVREDPALIDGHIEEAVIYVDTQDQEEWTDCFKINGDTYDKDDREDHKDARWTRLIRCQYGRVPAWSADKSLGLVLQPCIVPNRNF